MTLLTCTNAKRLERAKLCKLQNVSHHDHRKDLTLSDTNSAPASTVSAGTESEWWHQFN